jgi:hypothetical protein
MSKHANICSHNCYGRKDHDGSCCHLEDRDYIIGPHTDPEDFLERLSDRFSRKVKFEETLNIIPLLPYEFEQINNAGGLIKYVIQTSEFESSLKNKYGDFKSFSKNFTKHLLVQKNIVAAFASTPTSFSDAWNMKSEELIAEDVLALSKSGGHFQFNQIPYGTDKSGSPLL